MADSDPSKLQFGIEGLTEEQLRAMAEQTPWPVIDQRKTCSACHKSLHPEDFPEGPGNVCRSCRNAKQSERSRMQTRKDNAARIGSFITAASKTKVDVPHISEMASTMLRHFGGLENFCELWKDQIVEAATSKPGSKTALDGLRAIYGLVEASTRLRQTAPDVVDLTDDDLVRELFENAATNPDMLVALLEQNGYQISPPVDPEPPKALEAVGGSDGSQDSTSNEEESHEPAE